MLSARDVNASLGHSMVERSLARGAADLTAAKELVRLLKDEPSK
jgi:hypothetical protein